VQIGAFASAALADKGWSDVSTALPSAMAGKAKRVQTVEKDGKTFYRTSVAGFASRADAVSFCEALKAKGKACFVKG
jgi:cell division protein FtsN